MEMESILRPNAEIKPICKLNIVSNPSDQSSAHINDHIQVSVQSIQYGLMIAKAARNHGTDYIK